jgi:hypothetical protein
MVNFFSAALRKVESALEHEEKAYEHFIETDSHTISQIAGDNWVERLQSIFNPWKVARISALNVVISGNRAAKGSLGTVRGLVGSLRGLVSKSNDPRVQEHAAAIEAQLKKMGPSEIQAATTELRAAHRLEEVDSRFLHTLQDSTRHLDREIHEAHTIEGDAKREADAVKREMDNLH